MVHHHSCNFKQMTETRILAKSEIFKISYIFSMYFQYTHFSITLNHITSLITGSSWNFLHSAHGAPFTQLVEPPAHAQDTRPCL